MKNLKKLIAVVLTFTLVFSAMAVGFAGTFSDVNSSAPYASAVDRLQSLGLVSGMPNGTYNPDGAVTRAQMIAFVNAAKGLQDAAKVAAGPTKFSDVPANYWASGDINIANPDGYPDGTFKPDNTVTYPEALALLLRALGVTENLSWPYGVIAKAADIGLTDGVTLSANATINRGQMAVLVNNALDLPLYTYNSDGVLTEKKDSNGNVIKLISKVATPTEYIVLATADQTSNVAAGNVKLHDVAANKDVVKSAGSLDFTKYVGKDVNVYYTSSGVPVLVEENTNNVKEYSDATINTTSGEVYDASTTPPTDTNVSVKSLPILYNGYLTSLTALSKVSSLPSSFDVKLIDNNNDGKYEYAVVTGYNYDPMFVTANVTDSAKYLPTDNGNYTLVKDDGTAYHYTVVGDAAKLSDIKANDVVYYGKQYDADGNQVGIYLNVVRKTVSGKVTATYTDTNNYITVAGKDYKNLTGKTFSAGDEITFALDKDGNAFRYISGSITTSSNYGIVLNSAFDTSKLIAKIELLTADGKDTVYTWDTSNTAAVQDDITKGTLVKFDINSDKTVVSNVYDSSVGDVIFRTSSFTSGKYDATSNTLQAAANSSTYYYLNSSTVVYVKDANGNYSVAKLSDVTSSDSYTVNAIAYDNYNNVKAIVFDNPAFVSSDTTTTNVFVTKQYTVSTSNGDFNRITGYVNGQSQTFDTVNDSYTTVAGSVYALKVDNASGKVVSVSPLTSTSVTFGKIDTVNMTLDVTGGNGHYLLAPGYQIIKDNGDGTYSVKYASNLSSGTSIIIYTDSTGKVVAIKY
ncbi:S-layer homology domain-containing protein [Thermoanaerobacterium sp. RBIITD]|uniref:S-layer homology domain-containing protein n=1 Tax=Thermoanaerobacterium sp. RBIITD TaxID=1550240 RepID=UPI000BB8384B|nr:S-layer homology domain-containing protein [Thermoanaerobacterium sp. RBIITD]SNX53591.1 S-layer homology domain-containing protein [Thermoanaerobacterium sp. RBIITD]